MFHPVKGAIVSLYTVTLSCIQTLKHNHVPSFISIYFNSVSLLTITNAFFFYFFFLFK